MTKKVAKRKPKKTDKMSVPIKPTVVRTWWLVDVRETRTLKVLATGPKSARDVAAHVMMDVIVKTDAVVSFAHSVQCDEGRSTRDYRK